MNFVSSSSIEPIKGITNLLATKINKEGSFPKIGLHIRLHENLFTENKKEEYHKSKSLNETNFDKLNKKK
jgi:hypothetical protein